MSIETLLEVALALALVYLLFSLAVSALNEAILGCAECGPEVRWSLPRLLLAPFPKLHVTKSTDRGMPNLVTGWTLSPPSCPATSQEWWLKLLGLLITIAAISQGAPFWFDLLNRVTNLRAAGRPPEAAKPLS